MIFSAKHTGPQIPSCTLATTSMPSLSLSLSLSLSFSYSFILNLLSLSLSLSFVSLSHHSFMIFVSDGEANIGLDILEMKERKIALSQKVF